MAERVTLPTMPKVLVVDDDSHIRDMICFALRHAGFEVAEAENGLVALRKIERDRPDLVILDILMPEMDGLEVCRTVRSGAVDASSLSILFLSSKDEEVDRVVGLEIGGDDYIAKPFSPRELVARVKAHFRRMDALAESPSSKIAVGPLRMDIAAQSATVYGRVLELTRTEFSLLATLARRCGKVLNRDALMNGAYADHRIVSDRTIDSHMRRLRIKLRDCGVDPIRTVHGVGFRLAFPETAEHLLVEPSRYGGAGPRSVA